MAEMARQFSDREIAEDILTGHKYLANYYYAPAILESQNPELRSVLQQVYSDTQSEARQVFDYLNSKGWYPVKPADNVDLTELKNVAERSRNTVNAITQGTTGGQIPAMSMQQGQIGYQGQTWQTGAGAAGMNPQTQGAWETTGGGWQAGAQWQAGNPAGWTGATGWGGAGTGWQTGSLYGGAWPGGRWTGTQAGEGQGGMGPSSLAQWSRWGGQPSWTGFGGAGYTGGGQWTGQNLPGWQTGTTGWGGTGTSGWQAGGTGASWQAGRWTGTEAGEGQGGMGPSSVAQWSRWGGQPSWTGFGGTGYAGGGTGFGAVGLQGAGGRGAWQQPDIAQRAGQHWSGGQFGGGFGTGVPGTSSAQGMGTWYGGPSGSYQVNLPDWARQDRPELGSDRG